jgi:hypothetical protein
MAEESGCLGCPSSQTVERDYMTNHTGENPPEKSLGSKTTDTNGGASANFGPVGGPSAEQVPIKHMTDYSGASPPEHSLGSKGLGGNEGASKVSKGGVGRPKSESVPIKHNDGTSEKKSGSMPKVPGMKKGEWER